MKMQMFRNGEKTSKPFHVRDRDVNRGEIFCLFGTFRKEEDKWVWICSSPNCYVTLEQTSDPIRLQTATTAQHGAK